MKKYSEAFVGFDTAKRRHAVAIADVGCDGEIRYVGEIDSSPAAIEKLIGKLAERYATLHVCYEAGPTGYGLYRQVRVLSPPSARPARGFDGPASRWLVIGAPGACSSKGLEATATRPASARLCDLGSRGCRKPSVRLPGRLRSVSVRAIAGSSLPARRRLW